MYLKSLIFIVLGVVFFSTPLHAAHYSRINGQMILDADNGVVNQEEFNVSAILEPIDGGALHGGQIWKVKTIRPSLQVKDAEYLEQDARVVIPHLRQDNNVLVYNVILLLTNAARLEFTVIELSALTIANEAEVKVVFNQGPKGDVGPAGPQGLKGEVGLSGLKGDQGIAGQNGLQGPQGLPGINGIDGKTIRYGIIDPANSQGRDGDFFINIVNHTLAGPKMATWPAPISLIGPQGSQGLTGPQGPQGNPGLPGVQGLPGVNGNHGVDGKTIRYGNVDPDNSIGFAGDFYINIVNHSLSGPKTSTWPAPVSLLGLAGATGEKGVDGNTILSGEGSPSDAIGKVGDFYLDTLAKRMLGPKTSASWTGGRQLDLGGQVAHRIGEAFRGGIIFYLYEEGQHGLIAAVSDQAEKASWFNGVAKYTGATGDGLGSGAINTLMIMTSQIGDTHPPIDFAAKITADYTVMDKTTAILHGNWHLPSSYELSLMLKQAKMLNLAATPYWSSSEFDDRQAWSQDPGSELPKETPKDSGFAVRAVQAF